MPRAINRIRLTDHLAFDDVVTSSVLAARLKKRDGVSDAHARKMVSRRFAEEGLWRSEKLKLQQNERLFARRQFQGTASFFQKVVPLLEKSRPGIARCLQKLADELVLN